MNLGSATTKRALVTPPINNYVWVLKGAELHALPVKIGLSDGAFTEVSGAGVAEGLPVVTGETLVR